MLVTALVSQSPTVNEVMLVQDRKALTNVCQPTDPRFSTRRTLPRCALLLLNQTFGNVPLIAMVCRPGVA